jgi:hypothetical protein
MVESQTKEGVLFLKSPQMGGGESRVTRLRPNVILLFIDGYMEESFFELQVAPFDKAISEGHTITIFNDTYGFKKYDSGFREKWGQWLKAHRKQVTAVHMLVGSPLVKMGLNIINLFAGGVLKPYTDRAEWKRELIALVPSFVDNQRAAKIA